MAQGWRFGTKGNDMIAHYDFALRRTAVLLLVATIAVAQQTPTAAPGGPGRGGGFTQPAPSDWNNHDGWKQIFDGATLNGWNCDPAFWSVADGSITAKST